MVAKGCFSSAKQRHGRELCLGRFRQQAQERAGAGMRQWPARGIVDRDLPASQFGGHAPRQGPVGRNERGGAALLLQRFAQRQRDHQRLLSPDRRQ